MTTTTKKTRSTGPTKKTPTDEKVTSTAKNTKKSPSRSSTATPKKTGTKTTNKTEIKTPKPLENWDVDVWYAAIVLLICGLIGRLLSEYLVQSFLSDFSIGILDFLIPIPLSLAFSQWIKTIYRDEQKTVNSTIYDFLFSIGIVICLGVICRDLLGDSYLFIISFTILGMVISYLGLLGKFLGLLKKTKN